MDPSLRWGDGAPINEKGEGGVRWWGLTERFVGVMVAMTTLGAGAGGFFHPPSCIGWFISEHGERMESTMWDGVPTALGRTRVVLTCHGAGAGLRTLGVRCPWDHTSLIKERNDGDILGSS